MWSPQNIVSYDEPEEVEDEEVDPATDYETAIAACGFGRYNMCLLLAAVPVVASTIFETSTMSYIIPVAECDLDLTLFYKGLLNAMTYAGMIVSALLWGYVADTMGRRKVLVYALLLHGVLVLCEATSQTPEQLMALKFFCGFVNCGPFATMVAYLAEFHGKKHRSGVMMVIGIMLTLATLMLPIVAYCLLPHIVEFGIGGFKFHTWHVFLALTAIPSFLSGSLFALFPESPKFLMYQGKNDEALKVFQSMYALNTGKQKDTFRFSSLLEESPEKSAKISAKKLESDQNKRRRPSASMKQARTTFIDGLKQITPLCSKTYLGRSLLVYIMYFCILTSQNTVRLWLPQVFATLAELEKNGGTSAGMCDVLAHHTNKTIPRDGIYLNCYLSSSADSYSNNIIVATVNMVAYIVVSLLINVVGSDIMLKVVLALSCVSGSALYWSNTSHSVVATPAIFITMGGIAATTLLGASVVIFPTGMRTMVILMVLTFGRLGSLLGNVSFPFLIAHGCTLTFVIISGLMLFAFILSFFLPNTHKTELK